MGQFVQDERGAIQFVSLRRHGSEEDRVFAQEGRARMLHPAVSEAWNQHLIVFPKRKWLVEEIDHELNPLVCEALDFGPFLLRALQLRLAHEQSYPIRLSPDWSERPGGKGEKVCADRRGFIEDQAIKVLIDSDYLIRAT